MIKPLFNQILVEVEKESLALAQQDEKDSVRLPYGTAIDIGEDVKKIKIGDKIAFTIWGLNHLDYGESRYFFLPEDQDFLLGKIED